MFLWAKYAKRCTDGHIPSLKPVSKLATTSHKCRKILSLLAVV